MDGVEIIPDFLPDPSELVLREDTVEITLRLTRSSVEFFKEKASADNTDYRQIIRYCLDNHVAQGKTR